MLKDPIVINKLQLRNRLVMPPMATGKADGGSPTEELERYYGLRARGTGLIILEHEYVSPEGMAHSTQLSMAEDRVIPAYRRLTDAIHAEGCAVIAQISHAGAMAKDSGLPAIGPSAVSPFERVAAPQEMSVQEIRRVTDCFARSAQRAMQAGFDGVEIHSAHGYLLNQFYSPLMNRRTDAYAGDSLEGRTRLHAQILHAVREAVGEDCPLAIRFGACDYREGGSRIEEITAACRIFAEAGADLIDISGGFCGFTLPGRNEPGWFAELSRPAREAGVPVLLTGGVTTARQAEDLLQAGAADLIGVGRAMLNNPDWALQELGEGQRTE